MYALVTASHLYGFYSIGFPRPCTTLALGGNERVIYDGHHEVITRLISSTLKALDVPLLFHDQNVVLSDSSLCTLYLARIRFDLKNQKFTHDQLDELDPLKDPTLPHLYYIIIGQF